MRAHRAKFDWTRPFVLVSDLQTFDSLRPTDELFPSLHSAGVGKQQAKEQIVVPRMVTVTRLTQPKSFARITANYIRLQSQLNLPRQEHYELSQVDLAFLRAHAHRFHLRGEPVLCEGFMQRLIVELERRAGRGEVLPRNKGWLNSFVERECRELMTLPWYDEFATVLYNYWKTRREELRFPMWRPLWRPGPTDYGHLLAFKTREKETRNLRRGNRVVEDEIIVELYQQFELALKLANRIELRETIKSQDNQLAIANFYQEVKDYVDPALNPLLERKQREVREGEGRGEAGEKVRELHRQYEEYYRRRENGDVPEKVQVSAEVVVDQRQSIVNFLATLVYEAELRNISHDRLFHPSNNPAPIPTPPPPILPHSPAATYPKMPAPPQMLTSEAIDPQPMQPINREDMLDHSLTSFGDYLSRSFQQAAQPSGQLCSDYLDYKRRRVSGFYYGDDDEGDYRDLRKNVASNFKRFLQTMSK